LPSAPREVDRGEEDRGPRGNALYVKRHHKPSAANQAAAFLSGTSPARRGTQAPSCKQR
jgi:hypothetical protein